MQASPSSPQLPEPPKSTKAVGIGCLLAILIPLALLILAILHTITSRP